VTGQGGPYPSEVANRPPIRRVWAAYVGGFAIIAVIGLVFGHGGQTIVAIMSGVLGVGGIWYGTSRFQPSRQGAWALLAVAVGLLAIAETVLGFSLTFGDSYPSGVDVAFVGIYLPLAVAVLWIGHPPALRQHWPAALDTAVLSTAGTLIAWITLIEPTINKFHLTHAARALLIFDWVGDIAIISIGILLVLTWRTNRSAILLGVAILALLGADVLQSVDLLNGGSRGATADFGFLLFCALCGLAALDPEMAHITSSGAQPQNLGIWRMVALAAALLIPPSALLAEASPGPVHAGLAIALVGGTIGLLMLARVAYGMRALHDRTVREQALRESASELGTAGHSDDVVASVTTAARAMLGGRKASVSLHAPDPALTKAKEVREPDRISGFVRFPISPVTLDAAGVAQNIGEVRIAGRAQQLFNLDDSLNSLADQAGAALARISLADAVRDHERENYFRTLVQHSWDVILICRRGVVAYATPSAGALFARANVIGVPVEDLITFVEPPRSAAEDSTDSVEATVEGHDGIRRVRVHQRDMTRDDTIRGVVLTLHDVTVQRRLTDELAYRANHDALTGLPNGQMFRDEIRRAGQAAEPNVISAALFLDLDNFKEVNDTLGHGAGDELLKVAAERILGCLRRDRDLAARLGGDEFAVLLRNLHTVAAARDVAARVLTAFRRPVHIHDVAINCSVSIGLADASTRSEYTTLLRRADTALYAAKAVGKDSWREYEPDLPDSPQDEVSAIHRLSDQIRLNYQPIVDLTTGRPVGYEALTRVNGRSTSPADFIAEAEQSGLIVAVGDWVLTQALRDAPALTNGNDRYVSVNVSPVQLRHGGFAERILEQLGGAGVEPARMMLELTERLQLDAHSGAWDELAVLHDAGIRIALDDYGTGYASFSYLRHRAIDVIKLDRSFFRHPGDPRHRALLDIVVDVTRRLDVNLIAEGIETARALSVAREAGFVFGQGLYFAAAMPPEQAAAYPGLPGANGAAATEQPSAPDGRPPTVDRSRRARYLGGDADGLSE
jgi:diguanylate cyclase (GGDEF)-like protein